MTRGAPWLDTVFQRRSSLGKDLSDTPRLRTSRGVSFSEGTVAAVVLDEAESLFDLLLAAANKMVSRSEEQRRRCVLTEQMRCECTRAEYRGQRSEDRSQERSWR
eukprot:gnl/TRDRNA2_/TRDRNA2_167907_c0_seq1.p2 gnl/TRDRNA2_/TRDRNA2_167907_c0~~gnl/TRDRNA2_/TRDRNA2_167907_c0_seq1.p2  ORF type:complete len:105 (+),score=12.08 gnl/TRDRNA2_/TRDRNA2_167907_c0_seq1:65-379(+)